MTGDYQTETSNDRGIIPRTIQYLLTKYKKNAMQVSITELYNEKLYDLLKNDSTKANNDLPIREDQSGVIVVPGLTQKPIASLSEFTQLFKVASNRRSTAPTLLNKESSRSHSILTIYLNDLCKIHLIDLAGSEDNRQTGNTGKQLLESVNINKSLFQLRKVVDSLHNNSTGSKRQVHVAYRDSKLTRLLQDSLGGSSKTIVIANISEEKDCFVQTCKTLQFAAKTKTIINRVAPTMQEISLPQKVVDKKSSVTCPAPAPINRIRKETTTITPVIGKEFIERLERLENVFKESTIKPPTSESAPVIPKSLPKTILKRTVDLISSDEELDDPHDKENLHPNKRKRINPMTSVPSDLDCKKPQHQLQSAADLLTPRSKHKEAKTLLKKGNTYLSERNFQKAYYYYNQASMLIPENDKLQQKVDQIRKKARLFTNEEILLKFIRECKAGSIFDLNGVGAKKGQRLLDLRDAGGIISIPDLCTAGLWSEKNIGQFISSNIDICKKELNLL